MSLPKQNLKQWNLSSEGWRWILVFLFFFDLSIIREQILLINIVELK